MRVVEFLPPSGARARPCAVVWNEGSGVGLATPLLQRRGGIKDPLPFMSLFGPDLFGLDEFERSMEMLEAIAFGAGSTSELQLVFDSNPDWRMRCSEVPISNDALEEFGALLRAAEHRCPVTAVVAGTWSIEALRRLVDSEALLAGADIQTCPREDNEEIVVLRVLGTDPIRLSWRWGASEVRTMPATLRMTMRSATRNGRVLRRTCTLDANDLRDTLLAVVAEAQLDTQPASS